MRVKTKLVSKSVNEVKNVKNVIKGLTVRGFIANITRTASRAD